MAGRPSLTYGPRSGRPATADTEPREGREKPLTFRSRQGRSTRYRTKEARSQRRLTPAGDIGCGDSSERATIAPKSGVHRSAYRMTALILSMRLERRTRQLGLYIVANPWGTGPAVTAAGISARERFPTVA